MADHVECDPCRDLSMSSAIDEGDHFYATTSKENIIELARTMVAVGDHLLKPHTSHRPRSKLSQVSGHRIICKGSDPNRDQVDLDGGDEAEDRLHQYLSTFVQVLQEVLTFLETPAGDYWSDRIREREGMLRGVFNLTVVGSAIMSFGLVYLANKYLAVSDDSYKAERHYIAQCLQDIEGKQDYIGEKLSKAANIIQEMMKKIESGTPRLNISSSALQFDQAISEANLEVGICQQKLDEVETTLVTVMHKVQARRWLYVGLKSACVVATIYGVYKFYEQEKISTVTAAGTTVGLLAIWSLMGPSNGNRLFNELIGQRYEIKRGNQNLDDLRKRLTHHEDTFDKICNAEGDRVGANDRFRSI